MLIGYKDALATQIYRIMLITALTIFMALMGVVLYIWNYRYPIDHHFETAIKNCKQYKRGQICMDSQYECVCKEIENGK